MAILISDFHARPLDALTDHLYGGKKSLQAETPSRFYAAVSGKPAGAVSWSAMHWVFGMDKIMQWTGACPIGTGLVHAVYLEMDVGSYGYTSYLDGDITAQMFGTETKMTYQNWSDMLGILERLSSCAPFGQDEASFDTLDVHLNA